MDPAEDEGKAKNAGHQEEGKNNLVVGDSEVRCMDNCNTGRQTTRVRIPGSGYLDRMDNIMSGHGNNPIICLSVMLGNIGNGDKEVLLL